MSILSTLIIFAIALTACSSLTNGTSATSTQTGDELPIETQLVVGTLDLNGTEQDVTAEQAQELIVLWQVYNEISQSDTAAQEEVDGLIDQIQESMTTEQIQAITNMQLTQQDVYTAEQGLEIASSSSSSSGNTSNATPPSGDMTDSMPLDGDSPVDGGMPADFGGTGQAIGDGQATNVQAEPNLTGSDEVPSALVEALIQSLEQKIA